MKRLLAFLLLTGCAHNYSVQPPARPPAEDLVWSKPGASIEDFERDRAAAQLDALSFRQPAPYYDPTLRGGSAINQGLSNMGNQISARNAEAQAFRLGMESRGWRLVPRAELEPTSPAASTNATR